jgi:hypothetical protein
MRLTEELRRCADLVFSDPVFSDREQSIVRALNEAASRLEELEEALEMAVDRWDCLNDRLNHEKCSDESLRIRECRDLLNSGWWR